MISRKLNLEENYFIPTKERYRVQSRCINCGAPLADKNDKCSFCSPYDSISAKEVKIIDVSRMSKKEVEEAVSGGKTEEKEENQKSNLFFRFAVLFYLIHPFLLYYCLRDVLCQSDLVGVIMFSFFFGWIVYLFFAFVLFQFVRLICWIIFGIDLLDNVENKKNKINYGYWCGRRTK